MIPMKEQLEEQGQMTHLRHQVALPELAGRRCNGAASQTC
jgi:hypothetical protein